MLLAVAAASWISSSYSYKLASLALAALKQAALMKLLALFKPSCQSSQVPFGTVRQPFTTRNNAANQPLLFSPFTVESDSHLFTKLVLIYI
jgi:hypothetical protein